MEFVPILVYDNYIPAHIAMGRLEEEGINCWLKDENSATITPYLTNAIGGIKLMVAVEQAERAFAILEEEELQYKKSIACPKCGSNNIEQVRNPRKPSNFLRAIIVFFATAPMPMEEVSRCLNCGNEFEPI
jgi:DNA-directed RNA polymerase subunit RPC12/RpoP